MTMRAPMMFSDYKDLDFSTFSQLCKMSIRIVKSFKLAS